ncbi:MAG: sulfatase-like hydrolase/transferase [Ruminococcus sp.]|nr:sulfatase-like hydrolase/transferase [Ruminococcus sp.]
MQTLNLEGTSLKERLKTTFFKLRDRISRLNERRNLNSETYRATNLLLTILFPIFIVLIAEINQCKYPSKLIMFIVEKPTIFMFDIFISSIIFYTLYLLFRKGFWAVLIQGIVYFSLSTAELFKYGTNGNHLILTDMKLFRSVKSLTSFAYIKITPMLITYALLLIIYIGACFWFNPKLKNSFKKRFIPMIISFCSCVLIIGIPSVSNVVYAVFDVDTTKSDNAFLVNEKFENNNFIAFFLQTFTENISNKLEEPQDYTEDAIDDILDEDGDNQNEEDTLDEILSIGESDSIKPNVIQIMSESFADFRVFDELNLDTDAYDKVDSIASEGYKGTAIVPTYASFTVKTEFELLFGLPVKSLNDPNMPQIMLLTREQPTMVQYYHHLGYQTAYVHPFLSSFYSRKKVYSQFGFDTMIFQDDFTVPIEYLDDYITDDTVFRQIESLIEDSEEPLYVHTTTMQNHQPYTNGENPDDEITNYLNNIRITGDALQSFIDYLSSIDEPTVVVFIGDHFPSMRGENNVYDLMGVNSENCQVMFEQNYIIWSNYDLDYSNMPTEKFSTFYLPYVVWDLIDAPKDSFIQSMLDKMETLPIYSTSYDTDMPNDEDLDILTYDRILGDNVSGQDLVEYAQYETDELESEEVSIE